jgi:hypothetical protein
VSYRKSRGANGIDNRESVDAERCQAFVYLESQEAKEINIRDRSGCWAQPAADIDEVDNDNRAQLAMEIGGILGAASSGVSTAVRTGNWLFGGWDI